MTNQTETTKPEACDEEGGQVERIVRQREYIEWAQRETDRQRRRVFEAELKQVQFENAVCIAVQQVMAVNNYLILGMWYAALRDT